MSEVHGLGKRGPQEEIKSDKESQKAKVLSSSGRGLTERTPSRFEKIPLIGRLIGWFGKRSEVQLNRQEIINQLSEEYPEQAPWIRQSLEPVLRDKSLSELRNFFTFLDTVNGAPFLLMIQKNYANRPIGEGKQALEKGVNAAISLMQGKSRNVRDSIQHLFAYSGMISKNNSPQETFNFYNKILSEVYEKDEPKRAAYLNGVVNKLNSLAKTGVNTAKYTEPAIATVFQNIPKEIPAVQDSEILSQITDPNLQQQMHSILPDISQQDRVKLYNFLKNGGTAYFQTFSKLRPDGDLKAEVTRLVQSLHSEPELARRTLAVIPRMQTILGSRLTPELTYQFFNEIIHAPNQGFHDGIEVIASFERLANEFDKFQAVRPQVFIKKDKAPMPVASTISNLPMTSKFLKGLATEISEQIYADNTQVVYQAIVAGWKPNARGDYRTNENALKRNAFENSLEQEIHPDKVLTTGSEQIDFSYTAKVAIRDPQTGETRTLLKKVPIEGRMSKSQALLRMQLLFATCARGFESFYLFEPGNAPNIRKSGSTLAGDDLNYFNAIKEEERLALGKWIQNNNVKEKFEQWWDEAQRDYAKVMLDFSGTPEKPPFTFLRESTFVKEALEDPSAKNATIAAGRENILDWGKRADGGPKLALLPQELNQFNDIATLSDSELQECRQAFLNGASAHIRVPGSLTDADLKTATVTFSRKEIDVEGTPNAVLLTTITLDNKTVTRATQYPIETDDSDETTEVSKKTAQSTLEDVVNSREFQSAVLLAKSEFMRNLT